MDTAILKSAGIDYDNAVNRFMGDSELFEEALQIFLKKINTKELCEAFEQKDYPRMFEEAHSLKGTFANLDMSLLYMYACNLTELLRREPYNEVEIAREMGRLKPAFERVIRGIVSAM